MRMGSGLEKSDKSRALTLLSSSKYGSITLSAEFWPSQPFPSIFSYPGQESSSLALLTSVYLS